MFNVILIAIAAGSSGFVIGMNNHDVDCKNKAAYQNIVNYCKTGDVSGIPKEYHGLKCDKTMLKKVEQFNNICK